MPWLQVHVEVDREQAPLVERLLQQLGTLSVTHVDAADDPVYEPPLGTTPLWAATRVSGLFPAEQDVDRLRSCLYQGLSTDRLAIEVSVLDDRDWERAWLDRFEPMRFGQRLWVCPRGQVVMQADAVVVTLDPGLAFGTGTHPTTAMCLKWLDSTPLTDRTLVDFGCGSGILSLAGALLGAAKVLSLDHDPQAVTATKQNAQSNAVAHRIDVRLYPGGPIPPGQILVANILANVLIDSRKRLIAAVEIGGKIALSGILEGQIDAVRDGFSSAVDFEAPVLREGWALLTGRRRR